MPTLEDYKAFVQTLDRGSLTAAAKYLGRSLQSVSRALASIEDELGVSLVRRTTRRLQPTPAGSVLHGRIKAALEEMKMAEAEASLESERISGIFRIGASVAFGSRYVAPAAYAFMARYPGVEIELVLTDSIVDLIENRLDVAVRIGDARQQTLMTRGVAQLRRVIVASPDYLARRGRPRTPDDLAAHLCVVRMFGPEGDAWPQLVGGKEVRIPVAGTFRCNEAASANAAIVLGAGLGLAPVWQVRDDLDQGRLEIVLADFEPPPLPARAVWPPAPATPARTRLFIDMMISRLTAERI